MRHSYHNLRISRFSNNITIINFLKTVAKCCWWINFNWAARKSSCRACQRNRRSKGWISIKTQKGIQSTNNRFTMPTHKQCCPANRFCTTKKRNMKTMNTFKVGLTNLNQLFYRIRWIRELVLACTINCSRELIQWDQFMIT